MKILYVGTLGVECSTCHSRLNALMKLESDVHGFDTDPYFLQWKSGIFGRAHRILESHLLLGPRHMQANADLIDRCRKLRPNIVWIDTGTWVSTSTILELKRLGCFLVMHITDALVARHWRVRFLRRQLNTTVKYYDVLLTTNADDYNAHYGSSSPIVGMTDLGYDDDLFTPVPLSPDTKTKWANPIIFIGHYEQSTEAGILALINADLPVKVFGHASWFSSPNTSKLGSRLQLRLNNEDYAAALKGASIGLCFVSKLNYNQTAGRSFEIPGSGTFLLAERTPQHLALYQEGIEAEFFSSHEELVRKARYYLSHPIEREKIAFRGLERCRLSGYSWEQIMARDWPNILTYYVDKNNLG
jgi:hypothetical protein